MAKELGMTMTELTARVTIEELELWAAYFELEADRQKQAQRKR